MKCSVVLKSNMDRFIDIKELIIMKCSVVFKIQYG